MSFYVLCKQSLIFINHQGRTSSVLSATDSVQKIRAGNFIRGCHCTLTKNPNSRDKKDYRAKAKKDKMEKKIKNWDKVESQVWENSNKLDQRDSRRKDK